MNYPLKKNRKMREKGSKGIFFDLPSFQLEKGYNRKVISAATKEFLQKLEGQSTEDRLAKLTAPPPGVRGSSFNLLFFRREKEREKERKKSPKRSDFFFSFLFLT